MDTGGKIMKLRRSKKMSQQELASQLGISQVALHNIETGINKKIDFLLMNKVCDIFKKDFPYFTNDNVVNNNVKTNSGQISCDINCENVTVNNHYPESILAEIQNLIEENKQLKIEIAQMQAEIAVPEGKK
jgi:transcriptional regulator with XRE-family HTH domain